MQRAGLVALLTAGAFAVGGVAAYRAVAAVPAPPLADVTGYTGKGQLVAQTVVAGAKLTVGGDIALEERGSRIRLDVLSLALPGADAALSSLLATQLFPPGGFSVVYDRGAGTYTVWSNAKRTYYTSGAVDTPGSNSRTVAPAPTGAGGDLFAVLSPLRSLKDAASFSASVSLAGHGTVNGHPATGLDFQLARTAKSGDALDVHGRIQLADDLDAVPVQLTASAKSKSIPESALRLDVTSLAKQAVPAADLDVPAGYARAADVGSVVGNVPLH